MLLTGLHSLLEEVCWPFPVCVGPLYHQIHPGRCLTKSEKQGQQAELSISPSSALCIGY